MRKIGLLMCLLICLFSWGFVPLSNIQQVQMIDDDEVLRPEDYLFYMTDMSDELMEKFAGNGLSENCTLEKKSDLYIVENIVSWDLYGRIMTKIEVGEPDYWNGFDIQADGSYTRIYEIDDLGERALAMESSFIDIIHFIKGNSFVEVAIVGGDIVDIMPIAEKMATELPGEMPDPKNLELLVPAPAYDIQLPSKYIYNIYKSGEAHHFSEWAPDADQMYMVTRYPFTRFTIGVWSVEQNAYQLLENKTISISNLRDAPYEHNGKAFGLQPGEYELHYWVNGEFAANYPYRYVGVNE